MALNPNLLTIVFEILNFLVIAYLLNRFVFQPVMRQVKARALEKAELLQQMHADRDAAAALRKELAARLDGAEAEAAAIISQAQADAEAERLVLLRETQTEIERILAEAHTDAYRVRQQALDAFYEDLLTTILEVGGMVIAQLAPDEMHTSLVKQLSDRIWEMGRSEMQRVEHFRRSLGDRAPVAHITTARPLAPEAQGLLVRTFSALADRNVNLDVRVDPTLYVGVRVRMGDVLVDNSIAGQLEALRDRVAENLRERLAE